MDSIKTVQYRVLAFTLVFLALLLALSFLINTYRPIFFGLMLGTTISLYNILYLGHKVHAAGLHAINKNTIKGNGLFNRMLMAVFAVIISVKFPGIFDYLSVVIGLVVCYLIVLFIQLFTEKCG